MSESCLAAFPYSAGIWIDYRYHDCVGESSGSRPSVMDIRTTDAIRTA